MDKLLEKRIYDIIQRYECKELFWFIKNSFIESITQSGPQCGIVALCMALKSIQIDCSVDLLMKRARELAFTKSGEIFDIKFLADLVKQFHQNFQVVEFHSFDEWVQLIDLVLNNSLILIAYDCDQNFEPCSKQGLKAHWALITGAMIAMPFSESEHFQGANLDSNFVYCEAVIEEEKSKILNQYKDLDKIQVICRHGKSKYPGVWNIKKLIESNRQLKLIDHQKCDDTNFVKPLHGDLSKSLANRILILKK